MGKSLVIVESPAKAKTINRYLGDDYVVKSSIGHIRDLPVSGTSTSDPKARAKEAAKTRRNIRVPHFFANGCQGDYRQGPTNARTNAK